MAILKIAFVFGLIALAGSVVAATVRASYSFAPWIPSNIRTARKALTHIRPRPGSRFVDLGCGDGRIVFMAQRDFGLHATGYETSPIPFILARLRQLVTANKNVTFRMKNLYSADLSNVDIIYIYGLPNTVNERLMPKIKTEARHGTVLLSYNFSLRDKTPVHVERGKLGKLLVYKF